MPTTNENLADLAVRHAIHLIRYGNGVAPEIVKLLESVDEDIVKRIGGELAAMPQGAGYPYNTATEKRLHNLLVKIRALVEGVYGKGLDKLASELGEFAVSEADWQAGALDSSVPIDYRAEVPSPVMLRAIATSRPFEGFLLKDHFYGMADKKVGRIEQAIRIGMFEGQGTDKIVTRIIEDGTNRAAAESVVRTSISHVANQAAQETWKANERLLRGWQFVATLDSRTSLVCASLDGTVYPVGEGPQPPRHRGCRSTSIAVTKSFKELGIDKADYTPESRASMDGQVASSKNFETWLTSKPETFQREFLGPSRFNRWKSGDMTLRDFVKDNREVITLDELKKTKPKS